MDGFPFLWGRINLESVITLEIYNSIRPLYLKISKDKSIIMLLFSLCTAGQALNIVCLIYLNMDCVISKLGNWKISKVISFLLTNTLNCHNSYKKSFWYQISLTSLKFALKFAILKKKLKTLKVLKSYGNPVGFS